MRDGHLYDPCPRCGMRRRRPELPVAVDERLCRFVPGEWADDVWEAYAAWTAARLTHVIAHPDTLLGGPVDVLLEHRRIKHDLPGHPRPPSGKTA
jgi:hypothetical protein